MHAGSFAGLAPANNLESGIVANLPPGLDTALVAGRNNGSDLGLIEVYDDGPPYRRLPAAGGFSFVPAIEAMRALVSEREPELISILGYADVEKETKKSNPLFCATYIITDRQPRMQRAAVLE